MTSFEVSGPMSIRGDTPLRRPGRTIISRSEFEQGSDGRLSRIEAQGARIPALTPEELATRREREDRIRQAINLGSRAIGLEE